uniref:NADH dehydrogenase subunit 9 n=1 Tax=Gloeochaete wittrockiana TaxID=38269 RepID=A0A096Y6R6_9EUKA|nr:NADH dehydrogenase subunit 9 [Gloeochaete wittrockiana]AIM52030.1 NADH dehydrogenase subunit 9 [Gloeochaete wittrockiana]
MNSLEKYAKSLYNIIPNFIQDIKIVNNELIVFVDLKSIYNFFVFIKLHTNAQFKSLIEIAGIDYPNNIKRFEVSYELLSVVYNQRLRVKVLTDEVTPIDSIMPIFPSANWYEREVWDLFGVFFCNHLDLRRILTDYGFEGHPLRKDFPLSGYVEVRYDDVSKQVVNEPIEITQEFRNFDFNSPWEK